MAAAAKSLSPPTSNMSSAYVFNDSKGESVVLAPHFLRYGNRILDASYISLVTVKKNRLLFNSFKQNTTLPTFSIPFKTEGDASEVLLKCCEFYEMNSSNPWYTDEDTKYEVYLADAYGGSFIVCADYLKYRGRILGSEMVRTVSLKGRRVLINRYKSNQTAPTMCIHFKDKKAAQDAMNTIHSVLWNVNPDEFLTRLPIAKPDTANPTSSGGIVGNALKVLEEPADPTFLYFVTFGTAVLLFLRLLGWVYGSGEVSYLEHSEL